MVRSSSGIPNRLALNGGFGPGWFESILQLEPSSDKDLKYKMPVGDFWLGEEETRMPLGSQQEFDDVGNRIAFGHVMCATRNYLSLLRVFLK